MFPGIASWSGSGTFGAVSPDPGVEADAEVSGSEGRAGSTASGGSGVAVAPAPRSLVFPCLSGRLRAFATPAAMPTTAANEVKRARLFRPARKYRHASFRS